MAKRIIISERGTLKFKIQAVGDALGMSGTAAAVTLIQLGIKHLDDLVGRSKAHEICRTLDRLDRGPHTPGASQQTYTVVPKFIED